jgi:hypothetical protein
VTNEDQIPRGAVMAIVGPGFGSICTTPEEFDGFDERSELRDFAAGTGGPEPQLEPDPAEVVELPIDPTIAEERGLGRDEAAKLDALFAPVEGALEVILDAEFVAGGLDGELDGGADVDVAAEAGCGLAAEDVAGETEDAFGVEDGAEVEDETAGVDAGLVVASGTDFSAVVTGEVVAPAAPEFASGVAAAEEVTDAFGKPMATVFSLVEGVAEFEPSRC